MVGLVYEYFKSGRKELQERYICTYPPILWVVRVDGQVLVCIHTWFACQSHLGRPESLNLAANVL